MRSFIFCFFVYKALSDEVSCSESESDEEYENDDMKQLERQVCNTCVSINWS